MIENILTSLGLDQEEIKTYLLLLETGPTTVGILAKRWSVPRPSLYGFLERLQRKGVVVQSLKNGVKHYTALSPENLDHLFSQQIENLKDKRIQFQSILPNLQKIQHSQTSSAKVQVFEGVEGIKHVLKDFLLYYEIDAYSLWPIREMIKVLGEDFFFHLNRTRIRQNIFMHAIWPQNKIVDSSEYPFLGIGDKFKREIRVAPPELEFSMGYCLYKNRAAFISSSKECFGFIVESSEYYELLKVQFNLIWKLSNPLQVKAEDRNFLESVQDSI